MKKKVLRSFADACEDLGGTEEQHEWVPHDLLMTSDCESRLREELRTPGVVSRGLGSHAPVPTPKETAFRGYSTVSGGAPGRRTLEL